MTKVLVVDDSNSIRNMVSFTLKSALSLWSFLAKRKPSTAPGAQVCLVRKITECH
jgi:hypothetical protein